MQQLLLVVIHALPTLTMSVLQTVNVTNNISYLISYPRPEVLGNFYYGRYQCSFAQLQWSNNTLQPAQFALYYAFVVVVLSSISISARLFPLAN